MMIFGILGTLLIMYLLFRTDMFGRKDDSFRKGTDEALSKRYAQGTISREEYLSMREDISN
jgi:uncharacterized membrane protein